MALPYRVHRYCSPESAFFVNSYILEMASSVVVIDTQFLLSSARAVADQVKSLGKPLAAIAITHPHPDHFNGAHELHTLLGEVPIYATAATRDVIAASEAGKREQWKPMYGADYPDVTALPTHIVASGETVSLAGVPFTFTDLGAAESANQTVLWDAAGRQLFCGDLVYHAVHPWLAEGRALSWMAQLVAVMGTYGRAEQVYPGHGAPGTLRLLNQQLGYITDLQERVRAAREQGGAVSAEAAAEIKDALGARHPGWPLGMLHDYNIQGIAAELQAQLA